MYGIETNITKQNLNMELSSLGGVVLKQHYLIFYSAFYIIAIFKKKCKVGPDGLEAFYGERFLKGKKQGNATIMRSSRKW